MKRFSEMTEEELIEARETMTPEQIKEFLQEEEEELARLVKAAPIQEASIGEEEQEDDSVVQFNPETGEAVEVESTIVTREVEEGFKRKTMVTITDENGEDFGYFDTILIIKAIKKMLQVRLEEERKTHDFKHAYGTHWMEKRRFKLNEIEKDLREEITALRRIRNIAQVKQAVEVDAKQRNLKKEVQELPKEIIGELNEIVSNLAEELLDIL